MNNRHPVYVGIDVGSVSANVVVLDEHRNVIEEHYIRTKGEPLETSLAILEEIIQRYGAEAIELVATTGSGGKVIAPYIGATFTNEVIAQAKAVEAYHPEVKTIIEMGGQDAKLILLATEDDGTGKLRIEDFQMNSVCAAGTGSFLDQQATRMDLSIEEFGRLALKSKNPPRIAGRCSVFAKSDMIHLQQIATPDYDIVAGLCYAVARNFKATIGKGKEFAPPVSFQGGVAANLGVRKAFKDILELDDKDFIIPEHYASMGALGTVLVAVEKGKGIGEFKGLGELAEYVRSGRSQDGAREKLEAPSGHPSQRRSAAGYPLDPAKKVDAYLGLDIGSTSTNVVLIDRDMKLIAKCYLPTAGRPLEAVRKGLDEVARECGDCVNIVGVGATGSGRYLIGDFVGADVVRNEITAQAKAAAAIDPEVDTIFEIGGQDSKYIALKDGVVVDFEMNKVCAAGTGSFLEEQAERLGISIKGEFSDLALETSAPAPMGERCTVFIETDMVHHQQKGVDKGGLVAGLAYSIVLNYLNRVVGDRRIGNKIFFQGGTAANLAVVAAFEKVTGKKITVPTHHDVTGAIGSAILAMEEMDPGQRTRFKGFDLSRKKYQLESFECRDCSNICEIRKVVMEGEAPLYYGGRCEKYDVKKGGNDNSIPDLFRERERLLYSSYKGRPLQDDAPVIGIPRILMIHELYPFWKAFFHELGYRVQLSSPTNKAIISEGLERVVTESCFPVKVAHGHIQELIDKGVKKIFIPSLVNMPAAKEGHGHTVLCPYVQSIPYLAKATFDFKGAGVELVAPVVHFNQKRSGVKKELHVLGEVLGRGRGAVDKAADAAFEAQALFRQRMLERGREVLDGLKDDEVALVIVGRAYNTTDKGINLELPQRLRDLGVIAVPFDMLPVEEAIDDVLAEDMYWKNGQRILATAKIVRDNPKLFAIYITNFGCGPDSFITHFFKDVSKGKPFLQLEIDEHSADAGAITRCEAFLDSLRNVKGKLKPFKKKEALVPRTKIRTRLYIPNMADGAHALAAAFRACGIKDAVVMPMPDEESLKWGRRYTSGRECYPAILTTGDLIKTVRDPNFDPENSAFFMPSGNGPCRFGQYNRYHRLILDELGFKDVPIYAPDQDEKFYKELGIVGGNFPKYAWWGIVATDLLEKRLREVRPYEKNPGEAEKVFWESLHRVCDEIAQKKFPEEGLKYARDAFRRIPTYEVGTRPLVGIIGEIYVRSNRFSNENLVKTLESLGAEVRVPPVGEWIFYTNLVQKRKNWSKGNYGLFFKIIFNNFFQHRYENRMLEIFNGDLRSGHEPDTREILELAAPYIHDSFDGEAVLSVGKVIDYIRNGAHGIINVMPFTCMPGTVVNGILKKVREEYSNIPYLNMVFEGIEDTNARTRLEAFVHQAREFMERHGKGEGVMRKAAI